MGFLSSIFGGGAAGGIVKAVGDVADNLFTSDEEKMAGEAALIQAKAEMLRQEQALAQGQIRVNEAQARHPSMFVAGARPAIMWICAVAMAYHFLIYPLGGPFIEEAAGIALVDIEWGELSVILLGILGIGGLRTYEKFKGVARDNLKG